MMDFTGLTCHTGNVERKDNDTVAIHYREDQTLKTCFLNATTEFLGATPNDLAMKSVWNGLSVNVWVPKDAPKDIAPAAKYASVNWR